MIEVIPVQNQRQKNDFIDFPYALYQNHPTWIPPLKFERRQFFDPQKNPYYNHAKVALFLAYKNNKIVGRISAQINFLHNERYSEKTGHFGSFECTHDQEVVKSLFEAAENWLKKQDMTQMTGPFSFSTNEESGLLVEGFEHQPYPFTPYNFDYYPRLIENQGLKKIKDLIAWSYTATNPPEAVEQISKIVREYPGLKIRRVDLKNLKRDVKIISDVFNSAWSKNWGFVPWTEAEINKMAKELKLILDPNIALIAEVDGQPAAIAIAFPNFNEAIQDLNGKLFPFGFLKFLYRIKTHKVRTARMALLGIKKEFRGDILGGLSVLLYGDILKRAVKVGYTGGELSWTLEDNEKINKGIELMGGTPYRKFRVYGKKI